MQIFNYYKFAASNRHFVVTHSAQTFRLDKLAYATAAHLEQFFIVLLTMCGFANEV
jgi:hypothetical protein